MKGLVLKPASIAGMRCLIVATALLCAWHAEAGEKIVFSGRSASTNNPALPWNQKQALPAFDLSNTIGAKKPGADLEMPLPSSPNGGSLNRQQREQLEKDKQWIFVDPKDQTQAAKTAEEDQRRRDPATMFNDKNKSPLERFLAGKEQKGNSRTNTFNGEYSADGQGNERSDGGTNSTLNVTKSPADMLKAFATGATNRTDMMNSNNGEFVPRPGANPANFNGGANFSHTETLKLLGISSGAESGESTYRSGELQKTFGPDGGAARTTARDLIFNNNVDPLANAPRNYSGSLGDLNGGAKAGLGFDLQRGPGGLGDLGRNRGLTDPGSLGSGGLTGLNPAPEPAPVRPAYKPVILEVPKRKF